MKLFILCAVLIGLAAGQRRDQRCPMNENSRNPTQLPHPTDCNSFLKCHNGNAFEIRCPPGQHWNTRGNFCDNPATAGCTSVERPSIQPPRQNWPNRPNPRPEIEHSDYLNCPQTDTPGRIVYFPYHLNCSQFYQCSSGRAVLLRCPAGHSWNLHGNFCDRMENVACATPRRPL